ncbi:MAG: SRPBCC family protein [Mycobacterium sp.]
MRFDAVPIPVEGVEEFFATAPFVTRVRRSFAAPPEEVWAVVSGDRMWSWLPSVWGCRYPQDIVPAAGTVRDFQMYIHSWMVFAQHEQIIHFDAPRVMRYTALDATLPVFGSWCEEYRVVPEDDPGRATVDWTLACAPRYLTKIPGSRIAGRSLSAVLKPVFWFGLGGLNRELPARGPSRRG